MIKVHRITTENAETLRAIYGRFAEQAVPVYRWAHDPVEFDQVKPALAHRIVEGYIIEDTALTEPAGFMLYRLEDHRAIEINVIYSELEDKKAVFDRLVRQFIADIKDREGWDVVSYAMLGPQEDFIRTITWYGFKPIGQAIQRFNMLDPISIQVMKQQRLPALEPGYSITSWKPEYAGAISEAIHESFETAADAKWDPRFRTLTGAKRVTAMITGGMMGTHQPACTTVALKDGQPVGFCFIIQGNPTAGNIPLIGVKPSEKGKNLGNHLLRQALDNCIDEMLAARVAMLEVTTTLDTDNVPAIKMYRRMGFQEDYNYPHVYLTREKAQAYVPGQWGC